MCNAVCQGWSCYLAVMHYRRYNAQSKSVGSCFIKALNDELHGVQDGKCNSERSIIFQMVILQQAQHVTAFYVKRRQIVKRFDAWESGRYGMIIE